MTHAHPTRRALLALLAGAPTLVVPGAGRADEAAWAALARPGAVVLIRHARAPGTGDPAGFRLGECATQRNLSAEGRAQARRLGEALRTRGVRIERVLTSQWCRALDTAKLAFGSAEPFPPLNSFFADRAGEAEQVAAARGAIAGWRGEGALVMVTHQVNITALTGVFPREGELVIVRAGPEGVRVEARLQPAE